MKFDLTFLWQIVQWCILVALCVTALVMLLRRSDSPVNLTTKLLVTPLLIWGEVIWIHKAASFDPWMAAFCIALSVAACSWVLSVVWANSLIETLFQPFTEVLDGGNVPAERVPLYSIAIAKRKAGDSWEALAEVRRQLEEFPNDTQGVFMMATIQAEDLMDLPGAVRTMTEFCDQDSTAPRQVAAAFTQVADWQLKLAHDVAAACAAWQEIVDRFPGTDLAQLAENRIAHAAETEQHLLQSVNRPKIQLREGIKDLGLKGPAAFQAPEGLSPAERANQCLQHLQKYPADTEVRENLAMIYATDFQRLDMATMELRELIEGANHQPKQTVRWINLLATVQIKLGASEALICDTLKEIPVRFPKTTHAEVASRRIEQIGNELRMHKQTPSKKLGAPDSK